ncbi:zinc metalloproteinase nas-1 [Anoplophora glabripennis]|uniref:zinc metalloproteinase nas-1 n=1 Tax=Anoplophora glabripennis TaxID=217634 RepID=UPI0008750BEF|nr:zinc metalloproteinase nas-1 [Anoplophora glabripennis]
MILSLVILTSSLVLGFPLNDDANSLEEPVVDLSYLGDRVFLKPDPETGKKLETWNVTSQENPEELGEYAEGDIVFPKKSKNGMVATSFRWPGGVVPYEIGGYYSANDLEIINKAFSVYKKYTCVTFRPRVPSDEDYISIVSGRSGCWSSVGRIGGKQEVNLQSSSCTTKLGTPLHELMHAIGFLHEQSRYERDDHITVLWQNIKKGHENNFDKAEKDKTSGFGVNYDYRSVMHYSSKAFSSNGQPTLVPKDKRFMEKIGQRDGFSRGDITKINAMYNCPEKTLEIVNRTGTIPNGTNTNTNKEKESSNPLLNAAAELFSLFIH